MSPITPISPSRYATPRLVAALLLAPFLVALTACSSVPPNRNPVGETFPTVRGESLDGKDYTLPDDLRGDMTLLLIGYVQKAQFDADRWMLGLLQAEVPVRVHEVPTIDSRIASVFANSIDGGMRSGIPSEDWGSVITVYGDANKIVRFTGREKPRNMRVVLLDADGRVIWFHDRGYSPRLVLEIDRIVRESQPLSPGDDGTEPTSG